MNAQLQAQETQRKPENIEANFNTYRGFQAMHHMAESLANSTIIPESFRSVTMVKDRYDQAAKKWLYKPEPNPSGVSNCIIALNMSQRLNADPMMIMQNLYLIDGRPSWSSQFIIAAINSCGRYSPLRFEVTGGDEEIEIPYATTEWVYNEVTRKREPMESKQVAKVKNLTCVAWVIEKETGERLESSPISMELAVKEGWYQKNGSKWQTMPEQMLRYRAASFFGRVYAPELLMGLRSSEEEQERIIDVTPETVVVSASNFAELKRDILKAKTSDELAEIESKIYEVSDDKERSKLLELWKSKTEKSVQEEAVKKTEDVQLEPDPVAEQEVQVVNTSRSPDLKKQYSVKLTNAKTEKELAQISREIEQELGLTDTHRSYLNSYEQQRLTDLSKKQAKQTEPKADPIKSNGVKNGLLHQISEAQTVVELEVVAKNITANSSKMLPEHEQELLRTYAQRKEVLGQEDMFADVVDAELSYVDAVVLRIQNAETMDDINAEYADPAIEELSDADRKRIDDAASKREDELFKM